MTIIPATGEPWESEMPSEHEPHELQHRLEQAASDLLADFYIWRFESRRVLDTTEMPAYEKWLAFIQSLNALEGVVGEIEAVS